MSQKENKIKIHIIKKKSESVRRSNINTTLKKNTVLIPIPINLIKSKPVLIKSKSVPIKSKSVPIKSKQKNSVLNHNNPVLKKKKITSRKKSVQVSNLKYSRYYLIRCVQKKEFCLRLKNKSKKGKPWLKPRVLFNHNLEYDPLKKVGTITLVPTFFNRFLF